MRSALRCLFETTGAQMNCPLIRAFRRCMSIHGASNEIQRNIIAERMLGMGGRETWTS